MALLSSEKVLELIPTFFGLDLNKSSNIFRILEKILVFDEGFIYYANPDSLQLKFSYKNHANYDVNKTFETSKSVKDFIFSPSGAILNDEDELIKSIELFGSRQKSYLVSKISIKSTVFGIVVLSKREEDFYHKEDLSVLNAVSSVLAYNLKDIELSNVFKLQLKALQEAIIDKQNAYEVIKKQHKKLQEIDKTKNLFLANISHDLRTPLNAIIGFSQALDSKIFGDLNEKQSEYIKDIQISGLHLLGMINEILDISKLEAHVMKFMPMELNPTQVIQEVINILEPLYKNKNIEIVFENEFSGSVKADYQKFQQILFNLLSNAIKFTNNNGKIVVTSSKDKKNYILKVKDNGIGIEKKNHSKIFKKFVHLNNVYTKNSTGLGLTITKELVKLHNGKISLESEINKGTTFTMEFKNIIV